MCLSGRLSSDIYKILQDGAAFRLNQDKREGYTDFISVGGPDNYTWNVIRSGILNSHIKSHVHLWELRAETCFGSLSDVQFEMHLISDLKWIPAPEISKTSFVTLLIQWTEADELIFRHAGKSGAKIFDGVKVTAINFSSDSSSPPNSNAERKERPVSATYEVKSDGTGGEIKFDYIVYTSFPY